MKIVIVGAGAVGRHLAESLSTAQHSIMIIEESESLSEELIEQLDVGVMTGNGAAATLLAEAGVAESDLFLALTSQDTTNVVAASVSKSMGAKRTVARVHPTIQHAQWLFDYRSHFGIDYLFSVERLTAVELVKHIRHPDGMLTEELARGRIEVQQLEVSKECELVNLPLHALNLPKGVRIAALKRGKAHQVPKGTAHVEAGDLVTLFGDPRQLDILTRMLAGQPSRSPNQRVVIVGGGEYGFALAQALEGGPYGVRILEPDKRRCERLTQLLQDTVILQADGRDIRHLREEQVGEAEFFVATGENDEDNVMACLQAKSLGTQHALTIIHRADYAEVIAQNLEQLGMLAAVSPRIPAMRDLLRFVDDQPLRKTVELLAGVELLQFKVDASSWLAGKALGEARWPEGSAAAAVLRGEQAFVPGGKEALEAGDTVYAVVLPDGRKPLLSFLSMK